MLTEQDLMLSFLEPTIFELAKLDVRSWQILLI